MKQAKTTKQPLEDSPNEKIHVPRWLQNELYNLSMPYVDRMIEAYKKEGLGFSRFSLQSMGEQLICMGYMHANPNPPEEKPTPEKAVNERKALLDSHKELLSAMNLVLPMLENPKDAHKYLFRLDIFKEAINNAKNI